MADPNNFLCETGTVFCPGLGRCVDASLHGRVCPQAAYLPSVTETTCVANAGLSCLMMADSFESAACLRATQGPFQNTGALTQTLLSDMVYTPEAVLVGRSLSRRCISGYGAET